MNLKLSVVLITYNEEKNLERTLRAAWQVADEIVVLDSLSLDNTPAICAKYNVRFFQEPWQGYAQTKNRANQLAAYDWILSLDADEELSPELIQSILSFKRSPPQTPVAGIITRLPYYCGFWIRHSGWNPDKKTRLFNRKWAYWEGKYIHEKIVFRIPVATVLLPGYCYHYTVHSLEEHLQVINKFSALQAEELASQSSSITFFHLGVKPFAEFIRSYIIKGGFRDGIPGLIVSSFNAFAKFLKYAQYWMKINQKQKDREEKIS
jgi:glycosyltransferase involved in cell wall biosynthesis